MFEMIGDAIEILGVFFLSVEAIKLENLYKVRDRVFLRLQHGLQSGSFRPHRTKWTVDEFRAEHAALRHFFLSHYGAGLAVLTSAIVFALYSSPAIRVFFWSLSTSQWRYRSVIAIGVLLFLMFPVVVALFFTRKKSMTVPIGVMLIFVLTCMPLGIVPMALGEAAHQGSRLTVRMALRALEMIASNTPTGTIGILGFIAVCVGKLIQLAASAQH